MFPFRETSGSEQKFHFRLPFSQTRQKRQHRIVANCFAVSLKLEGRKRATEWVPALSFVYEKRRRIVETSVSGFIQNQNWSKGYSRHIPWQGVGWVPRSSREKFRSHTLSHVWKASFSVQPVSPVRNRSTCRNKWNCRTFDKIPDSSADGKESIRNCFLIISPGKEATDWDDSKMNLIVY